MSIFSDARIAVTGACGTIGSALIDELVTNTKYQPDSVIGIDNNESALFFVDQKHLDDSRVSYSFADVRGSDALNVAFRDVDIVFHAAALKHVIISERTPYEAVRTNIEGVHNVIRAAQGAGVKRVIFTSSDKAVNPTSVMGTSKLMGERLITAANAARKFSTSFGSTRFGNVLGSTGSVVPIFHRQIADGGPVTITHNEMTRFVMSISEAANLVLDSAELLCGGEVFITKMPVLSVVDLAKVMIDELAPTYGFEPEAVELQLIGMKPGEKLYEELMSEEETRRALEIDRYFSVPPAFRGIYGEIEYKYPGPDPRSVDRAYISDMDSRMSMDEIREFLNTSGLLQPVESLGSGPLRRYWPGDKEGT